MKNLCYILFSTAILLVSNNLSLAQSYFHPTTGIQSEYVGACLVSNCGPFNYYDNGGSGSNYMNGVNLTYRVFCPNQAGNCLRVTFNSFNVEAGYDFLQVKNGPTQNSTQFTGFPNSGTNYAGWTGLDGNLNGVCPFSFTSTDPSGCLTFRFYSDGSVSYAGWSAVIQCVPCASGPNGTDNNDCINATPICSSASISGNSTGPGIVAEGCNGSTCPAGGENHTNWYTFTAQTSGTLDILINPDDNNDDYDFAVYGPNVTCGALGNPIRCSDSGLTGNTGITNVSPNQNIENVNGDGFVETMNVIAGESYFLVIDEWSPNAGSGYSLSFSGTASLDCTILPVELVSFDANYVPENDLVDLHWITASERDNERFDVEHSTDGINYEIISTVKGAGNSEYETQYYVIDENPVTGVNYYRLNQWDTDGENKYSEVISVNVLDEEYDRLTIIPNPTEGSAELTFNTYSAEDVLMHVTSADGRTVIFAPLETVKGGNRFHIDLSAQVDGVYIIQLITKDKSYVGRVIKD